MLSQSSYLGYFFRLDVNYGTLFTVVYFGVGFLCTFNDLILLMDLSTLVV